MADGTIDLGRATTIAARTHAMTDVDAAYADEVLAAAARACGRTSWRARPPGWS